METNHCSSRALSGQSYRPIRYFLCSHPYLSIITLVTIGLLLLSQKTEAVMYEYIGPNFNVSYLYGRPVPGATNIKINFTTSDLLPVSSNVPVAIDLSTITISNGLVTLSGASSQWCSPPNNYVISTDSNGLPSSWAFYFYQTVGSNFENFSSLYHWNGYPNVDQTMESPNLGSGLRYDSEVITDISGHGTWHIVQNSPVPDPATVAPVPEPSTMLLLGAGIGGLLFVRRRKPQR